MAVQGRNRGFGESARASVFVFVPLAALATGMTLLYLGMRSVMEIGGSCASGGPYVSMRPCPDGAIVGTMGGAMGGLVVLGLYAGAVTYYRVPSFLALAWPALFLSLGWNFLEFGLDPPGAGSLGAGWLVCAVVFGLMGGIPLVFVLGPVLRSFAPKHPQGPVPARASMLVVNPEVRGRQWEATMRPATPATPPAEEQHPAAARAAARGIVAVLGQAASRSRPAPAAKGSGIVAALERLAALQSAGQLTDAEFSAAKRRLIEDEG